MCIYSFVHDWAHKLPDDVWTKPIFDEYKELIERLKLIDKKLELPDCNPNKGTFLDEIAKRLDALEKKVG